MGRCYSCCNGRWLIGVVPSTSGDGARRRTILEQVADFGLVEAKAGETGAVQSLVLVALEAESAGKAGIVDAVHGRRLYKM